LLSSSTERSVANATAGKREARDLILGARQVGRQPRNTWHCVVLLFVLQGESGRAESAAKNTYVRVPVRSRREQWLGPEGGGGRGGGGGRWCRRGSPGVAAAAAVGLEGVRLGPELHELHGGRARRKHGAARPAAAVAAVLPLSLSLSFVGRRSSVDDSFSAASARRVPPLRLLTFHASSSCWGAGLLPPGSLSSLFC
jgi:hypothetical protein